MLKNLFIYGNIILPAYQSEKGKHRKEINSREKELMYKLGIIEIEENSTNEVSGDELQGACVCRNRYVS